MTVQLNPDCTKCKLHRGVEPDEVCVQGHGNPKAKVMVVSRMHNSGNYQDQINQALASAGIPADDVYFTAALKCRDFEASTGPAQTKQCKEYLDAEIQSVQPEWVLAFGNEALQATTGHSGITKYRGKTLPTKGKHTVIATLSPAAVTRNPGQAQAWMADVHFFGAQVRGQSGKIELPGVAFIDTKAKFAALKKLLANSRLVSYDIETVGLDSSRSDSAIVSLAGLCELSDGRLVTWALPLFHPQSPFRSIWRKVLRILAKYLAGIRKQIAHNGKYDAKWMRDNGVHMRVTYDTMLAAHLLDENRLKGLEPQVTSRFGVANWKIDTKNLLTTPLKTVLKYNAMDVYYTYHLYLDTKKELLEQPRLLRIFQFLTIPTNERLIEAERRGIWIDRERLATNTQVALKMRQELEDQLHAWIPDPDEGVKQGWPTKGKRGKPAEVNFNASNWLRWWLFDYLGLPVIERGKPKEDALGNEEPGAPSVKEAVMLELKGKHDAVDVLIERAKWQKYCSSFLPQYDELADENDRIHTTYKLAGTVTGRLSSGKEDIDKVSNRVDHRGVNIQQVPRDPFIRGLFGAAPGFTFVEVDFSQVELRVVAFLSRDRTMLHLYQTGQDIHRATASWVMGIPASEVGKEDRKKAKAINFGFVYGMYPRKFVMTAWEKYELVFTIDEATEIRRLFFEQFKGLLPWHARQKRLVQQHGRVQSPIGRIRHLPDIYSEDKFVRMEAERQAINSPVQSFASDMNQLAMLESMNNLEAEGLEGYPLGMVHDATLFEIRTEHLGKALPLLKNTFENLPLQRKFGVHLDVPIIADVKVGSHWGDAQEMSDWEINNWDDIPF